MDRRQTLKTLMIGTVAGGATISSVGCKENLPEIEIPKKLYGRLKEEKEWDEQIEAQQFFDNQELSTIATLCDIILPATSTASSATDADVPAFIEFIVKDLPDHQVPIRGGLMWLNGLSQQRFNKLFDKCSHEEQISIVEDIAYPDPNGIKPDMGPGIKFFDQMRNLTLTGYYTTKSGFDDLGYKGNTPNMWDGVPDDVLKDHDVDYDEEWLAKCVDQDKREDIAQWDEDGNLLT